MAVADRMVDGDGRTARWSRSVCGLISSHPSRSIRTTSRVGDLSCSCLTIDLSRSFLQSWCQPAQAGVSKIRRVDLDLAEFGSVGIRTSDCSDDGDNGRRRRRRRRRRDRACVIEAASRDRFQARATEM